MKKHTSLLLAALLAFGTSFAGNPDRAGSAGASQLLINPWAASNGLAGSNMASVKGLESTFLNVAGLAFVERNELAFANSMYLGGTGIALNSLGFATKVGGSGVLGLSVTSMSLGDIPITTEDLPEGGIGSFSPAFSNIGVTYSKSFSNSIYGGLTMRIVSESISNVRASGVCFDAGIRYVTGENDGLRFGIALRNVGAPMRYAGDGLTVTATPPLHPPLLWRCAHARTWVHWRCGPRRHPHQQGQGRNPRLLAASPSQPTGSWAYARPDRPPTLCCVGK